MVIGRQYPRVSCWFFWVFLGVFCSFISPLVDHPSFLSGRDAFLDPYLRADTSTLGCGHRAQLTLRQRSCSSCRSVTRWADLQVQAHLDRRAQRGGRLASAPGSARGARGLRCARRGLGQPPGPADRTSRSPSCAAWRPAASSVPRHGLRPGAAGPWGRSRRFSAEPIPLLIVRRTSRRRAPPSPPPRLRRCTAGETPRPACSDWLERLPASAGRRATREAARFEDTRDLADAYHPRRRARLEERSCVTGPHRRLPSGSLYVPARTRSALEDKTRPPPAATARPILAIPEEKYNLN